MTRFVTFSCDAVFKDGSVCQNLSGETWPDLRSKGWHLVAGVPQQHVCPECWDEGFRP